VARINAQRLLYIATKDNDACRGDLGQTWLAAYPRSASATAKFETRDGMTLPSLDGVEEFLSSQSKAVVG